MGGGVATDPHAMTVEATAARGPAPISLSAQITALSPQHYYKFNEASGSAIDYGSLAINATAVGTPSYRQVAGPDGDSYAGWPGSFDGFTAVVSTGQWHLASATGETITVCAAVRPTTWNFGGSVRPNILIFGDSVPRFWRFGDGFGAGDLFLQQFDNTPAEKTRYSVESTSVFTTAVWHFVVGRLKRSVASDFWIDTSTERAQQGFSEFSTIPEYQGGTQLNLGHWPPDSTYDWRGQMAHMAIWNGALSDDNILALINAARNNGWTP